MDPVLQCEGDAQTFERAQRLGFAGVEIVLSCDDLAGRERLERLRTVMLRTGRAIPSLVLGEHSDRGGIADTDTAVAERAREDVERTIEWAAELQAGAILIPFFGRAEFAGEADLERAAAAFRPLCDVAGERGVTLCYEGTLPADAINALANRVGSRAFACYFDLANVVPRGLDSATEIRALGRLIARVHFKDVRVTVGDTRPGLGRVDFAECARALEEIGYDGWIVLETPPGPPELVARDLSFARSVLPGLEAASDWPRLGIFTYDFGRGDWNRLVETCRRLGLRAVQLGGPLLEECLEQPDRIEPLMGRLENAGISVAGLAGYRNLVAPDPATRRTNIDFLKRCLELAQRFGTSVVATETGTRNPQNDWWPSPENRSVESWASLDDAISELLEVAERHESILAIEGSVNHVLGTHAGLDGLIDRFPSDHLQLMLDPYNYLSGRLLPAQERLTRDFLDRFERRFVLAHLKDVGEHGADVSTVEFGTGVFRQAPYLEFLARRRPDLPLILEHLPLDHLPDAIRRVEELSRSEGL